MCYNIVCGEAMKEGKENDDGGGGDGGLSVDVGVWKPSQAKWWIF